MHKWETILPALESFRHTRYNLEFRCRNFTVMHRGFWNTFGPKIVELRLVNCMLEDETFRSIVTECTSLSSFAWIHKKPSKSSWLCDDFCSKHKKNMENKQLQTLKIKIRDDWVSVEVILRLLEIFPSLKRFRIARGRQIMLLPLRDVIARRPSFVEKLEAKFTCSKIFPPVFIIARRFINCCR